MNKQEKVLLVRPYLISEDVAYEEDYWPPLESYVLGSYLKEKGFSGEIKIADQAIHTGEQIQRIIQNFKPTFVGFSPNMETYDLALEQAKIAKSNNAKVILGGSFASTLAANILRNQPDLVDYVVKNDGEQALLDLVDGKDPTLVPNLVFRAQAGQVLTSAMVESVVSSEKDKAFEDLMERRNRFPKDNVLYTADKGDIVLNRVEFGGPEATFAEVDYSIGGGLEPYFENYLQAEEEVPFRRPTSLLTSRGCEWRCNTGGGCEFCFHGDSKIRRDKPEDIVRRMRNLQQDHKVDAILFPEDDFLSGDKKLGLNSREKFRKFHDLLLQDGMDIWLGSLFSRIGHITPEMVEMLARTKVWEMFFGLESANIRVLRAANKGNNPRRVVERFKLLQSKQIYAIPGYVLGMRTEDEASLGDTLSQAEELSKLSNTRRAQFTIHMPFPGCTAYERLTTAPAAIKKYPEVFEKTPGLLPRDPEMVRKYGLSDNPLIEELQRDWVSRFCEVSFERLQCALRETGTMDYSNVFNPSNIITE